MPLLLNSLKSALKKEPNNNNSNHVSVHFPDTSSSNCSDPQSPVGEAPGSFYGGLKHFNIPGLNLPILDQTVVSERVVILHKLPSGDFGFQLRRAAHTATAVDQRHSTPTHNGDVAPSSSTLMFAEPIAVGHANKTGLLPGDQLLEVNGCSVLNMSRDEIVKLIKCSSSTISLKVRPVPELTELMQRTHGDSAMHFASSLGLKKGDLQIVEQDGAFKVGSFSNQPNANNRVHENGALFGEKVWLSHRGGYAPAVLIETSGTDESKAKIRLETDKAANQILDVDSDDLDKQNPPTLDRCEDLAHLIYLNECSALHVLRQRYKCSLIHTYAGSFNTVVINPSRPLSIYSEKVVQLFKGSKRQNISPHIYSVAQNAFYSIQMTRRNQSIVFTGRSGSGKTTQARHLLHYLCAMAGTVNNAVTVDKLSAMSVLFDAFGHSRTCLNNNASRFCNVVTVEFDHVGQIVSGFVQTSMLEANRVIHRPCGETNFNIFTHLWSTSNASVRDELQLDSVDMDLVSAALGETNRQVISTDADEALSFNRILAALKILGVDEKEVKAVINILGAIVHLACAGATKGPSSIRTQFLRPTYASKAASMLGCTLEELHKAIFVPTSFGASSGANQPQASTTTDGRKPSQRLSIRSMLPQASLLQRGSSLDKSGSITDFAGDGADALETFIVGLYRELFSAIIFLINRSISSNYRTLCSIVVVDSPGLQNPASVSGSAIQGSPQRHHRKAANFDEFCFNYAQERIQGLYYSHCFTSELDLYEQENIRVDFTEPSFNPSSIITLIDKQSQQNLMRSTNIELRSQEKRGLLWLLDEEAVFPAASDESFFERIFVHHEQEELIKRADLPCHFLLKHFLGTNPILYNVAGWKRAAQENPVLRSVLPLLQDSRNETISALFLNLRASAGVSGLESVSASARRLTTVFKTVAMSNVKRKSVCAMVKAQMDFLIENLRRTTKPNFVHCFLAHHEDGFRGTTNSSFPSPSKSSSDESLLNVSLLRSQIRGLQLLDAVRLNKIGFPERMYFAEFRRRFECLAPLTYVKPDTSAMLDDKQSVASLISALELDPSCIMLGSSQVFMRSSVLHFLEDERDAKLGQVITKLQAHCRTFVAKKVLEKRKVQKLAIQCLQKNIVRYMKVKSWPWWKLYTRVLPLLDVNRTEDELKNKLEELETLREKLKSLEQSHAELRAYCDRLEARCMETQSELSDERSQHTQAADLLEQESTQRIRLDKENGELKTRCAAFERNVRRLELEVMEYRNLRNILSDGSDDSDDKDTYKEKYEQNRRLFEAKLKQVEFAKEEELERVRQAKQQTDRKLSEVQKELEEAQKLSATFKRRAQHTAEEFQDVRIHMQNVQSKNTELERKQKRFDAELKAAKESVFLETAQREKLAREKDELSAKIYCLERRMSEVEDELAEAQRAKTQLSQDLNEYASKACDGLSTTDNKEVVSLRQSKVQLEEELDDLAGELHQTKQNVTKLEMQLERLKQDQKKEAVAKEAEMEELRSQAQRRLTALQQELEHSLEKNQELARQRKQISDELFELQNQAVERDEAAERHLKRDLKRTKALLQDAQTMLQQHKEAAPSRGLLKQLKNQLEDLENERLCLTKSKQNQLAELAEVRQQLDQALSAKSETDAKYLVLTKEKNDLISQIDNYEEEMAQLLKKYKAQVQQASIDHITISEQVQAIADHQKQKEELHEQILGLTQRLQYFDENMVDKHRLHLTELKLRDTDAKLELERSSAALQLTQYGRTRETIEHLQQEIVGLKAARDKDQEIFKRLQHQLTDLQDEAADYHKEKEETMKRKLDLEAALQRSESAHEVTLSELKLAQSRIDKLEAALVAELSDDLEDDLDDLADDDGNDSYVSADNKSVTSVARTVP